MGKGSGASYSVRLENVSVSWSVDEAVSTWYATTRAVTIRNSIVAEALRNAGHPKGRTQWAFWSALARRDRDHGQSARQQRPSKSRNGGRLSAFVANNYIVNPGLNAIHFYSHDGSKTVSRIPLLATVIANVVVAGPNTSKRMSAVHIPPEMAQLSPDARLFIEGNVLEGRDENPVISNGSRLPLLQARR